MKILEYKMVRNSLLSNQMLAGVLIFAYCTVYGVTAQIFLSGIDLTFFLSSLIFALSIIYIRDPDRQKEKVKRGILYNQIFGGVLVILYLVLFGISSITLFSSLKLIFFMSSYTFAMSLFYIRDPDRIKNEENTSSSTTYSPFTERNPCFINSQNLSWLVRELNSSLSTVIGFSELLLRREYSENEKEYMLRNIYEQALEMSCSVNKVSLTIPDSPTKPKEIHEVVDLLNDKNFI